MINILITSQGGAGNGDKEGLILFSKSMRRIRVIYKHQN